MDQWVFISELESPHTIEGHSYRVSVEGLERADGTWAGRIVFRHGNETRTTEQETSQPNRTALEYWATGLEQIFLEGAFARAA